MKTANYIEGKLEEFRLSGKTPAWIGVSDVVMRELARDLDYKNVEVEINFQLNVLDTRWFVKDFLGLRVIFFTGPEIGSDGVYIQEKNATNDGEYL
ncbi:MAG TPA: hypothetical protein DDY18_05075 [Flavobacterium sp.]|nr:hypothetical protein [Flavobacterium sp.]